MKLLRDNWPILASILVILIFFRAFIFLGLLPIPADTIVGLYHPFRDFYSKEYSSGIPFKNFLITDPVRQLLPWRELTIDLLKRGEIPFWNPYVMAGSPHLANFQSSIFYPLNIIFFVLPFPIAWPILIFSQPFFGSLFTYLYLRNLGLLKIASFLGALAFSFSGFFVAWLTWGTILHSALWLPLMLLSIDKIFLTFQAQKISNFKHQISNFKWPVVFIFSLSSSLFAGHLQTFFYVFLVSVAYFVVRCWQYGKNVRQMLLVVICYLLFVALTAVQWLPTLQFILESARGIDQNWQKLGWFIPVQHLAQFIAPDFFGNPTTLNYFGIWNYAEFVGYIGILPIIFSLYAIVWRRDKKTLFFTSLVFISFIFSFQNPISELPYRMNIPFLSTSQPTRLLSIIDFSLVALAALGLDLFIRRFKFKKILYALGIIGIFLIVLWIIAINSDLLVSKRNLILPTALFIFSSIGLILITRTKNTLLKTVTLTILLAVTIFDLLRFADKFTPFTKKEYLFPQTKTIEFLKEKEKEDGLFRVMTTDDRILPPNFSIMYKLQTIDGYDPLYLRRYGELIAASERGEPNIDPPFGFNRIITPQNYESKIIDLLGVKYILSLTDLSSPKLSKVFQEGQTLVYENKNALPRAFFAEEVKFVNSKEEALVEMFKSDFDGRKRAVVEGVSFTTPPRCEECTVRITNYSANRIRIEIENESDGFLVLMESFYPMWRANIDGQKTLIYKTDYNFRGIIVPAGKHKVELYSSLL